MTRDFIRYLTDELRLSSRLNEVLHVKKFVLKTWVIKHVDML